MTPFERKQPEKVFVQAGKDSFMIGIHHVMANPYTLQPFKTLWEKGFRRAKLQYEQAKFARQRAEALGEDVPVQKVPAAAPTSVPVPPRTGYKGRTPRVESAHQRMKENTPRYQGKPAPKPTEPKILPVTINTQRYYKAGTIGSYLKSVTK